MNRKIFYVDCYYEGTKERNIGFIKLEEEGLFVMLRGLPIQRETVCKVYIKKNEHDRKYLMDVSLKNGYGQAKINWSRELRKQDCREIYIPINQKRYGRCIIDQTVEQEIKKPNIQVFPQGKAEIKKAAMMKGVQQKNTVEIEKEQKQRAVIEPLNDTMPMMEQDKWKQLCKNYPQVHIYPEADTVVIKPKDMVILTQEYHELATNSFVLHAYYNYRQLLLLRYHQGMDVTYFLGVPGVYYEREKRIALMFGFEGFENGESRLVNEDRRQAYAGCFGYYMKQVNI